MEFQSINAGYRKLNKQIKPEYVLAWQKGQTGFPLIDACMRCLNSTGYLNFRMRAMLVSFLLTTFGNLGRQQLLIWPDNSWILNPAFISLRYKCKLEKRE